MFDETKSKHDGNISFTCKSVGEIRKFKRED